MASGNFLVGELGLSLKGFNEYFLPRLGAKGYKVKDILELGDPNGVLISLVGVGNLEKEIEKTTKEVHDEILNSDIETLSTHNFHVNFFKTLGIYENDETASQNFPLLAQQYLCDSARKKINYLNSQISSLANKKISDF